MTQHEPAEGYVAIARVRGAHGVRGELKIEQLAPDSCFQRGSSVFVAGSVHEVERLRASAKARLLKLAGINTREAAAALRDELVQVREEDLEPLPEGDYYRFQIIGIAVRTADGRDLGRVVDIMSTGAADVYAVQGPLGEVLIPATQEIVTRIDLEAGTMTIEPMPGLLPD